MKFDSKGHQPFKKVHETIQCHRARARLHLPWLHSEWARRTAKHPGTFPVQTWSRKNPPPTAVAASFPTFWNMKPVHLQKPKEPAVREGHTWTSDNIHVLPWDNLANFLLHRTYSQSAPEGGNSRDSELRKTQTEILVLPTLFCGLEQIPLFLF